MKPISAVEWLDERTGFRKLINEALFENVPGGSRWRYVWGSTLTFALVIQFITGIFLWMAYSPSSQTAWESVYYIQYEMVGGWFLRGVHHWTAQVMTVLLVLHLMQVLIDGAYKAPREINFWSGLILLQLVLGLSLTGYLLPWDQKGYWATQVATKIAGVTPFIGESLQTLIVGGSEYGHHTLTRFFALHAGVLPALVIATIGGHIYLFRRHGITEAKAKKRKPDSMFWPDQVLKDAVACLAVLATVLFFVIKFHGAHLSEPADPSSPFDAARPDWYFLFLFEFLKLEALNYLPGNPEVWGAIVIPGFFMGLIFAMPIIARWKLGHRFNLAMITCMLVGAGILTVVALNKDANDPMFIAAKAESHRNSERVVELAGQGIPREGAVTLLYNDPLTRGPILFAENCASCHRYNDHDGTGKKLTDDPTAPDLHGFGSRDWLAGFLDPEQIDTHKYYGGTAFKGGTMSRRVVNRKIAKYDDEEKAMLEDLIIAVSAEAKLKSQQEMDAADAERIKAGKTAFLDELGCADCHLFGFEDEDMDGPSLTGWASREWMIDFVKNPSHPNLYGEENDRMPAFGDDGILTDKQIGLVVDWLRGEWHVSEKTAANH